MKVVEEGFLFRCETGIDQVDLVLREDGAQRPQVSFVSGIEIDHHQTMTVEYLSRSRDRHLFIEPLRQFLATNTLGKGFENGLQRRGLLHRHGYLLGFGLRKRLENCPMVWPVLFPPVQVA